MSKYWGVGEEDDYIPPTTADYTPPMRFEPKQAKIKSDTEYNGRSCRSNSQRDRGGTGVKQKVGNLRFSLHVKSTRSCLHLLRKCELYRIKRIFQ